MYVLMYLFSNIYRAEIRLEKCLATVSKVANHFLNWLAVNSNLYA